MAKKIKPMRRNSAKLVAAARDYVLHALDTSGKLLTKRERLKLIESLHTVLGSIVAAQKLTGVMRGGGAT